MHNLRFFFALSALLVSPIVMAAKPAWDKSFYDPAPLIDKKVSAADLIVPLPCGGAIAMMRVDTNARADDPLDDQRFRMGAPDISRAPFEYTRTAYIRGPFLDEKANSTFYLMGRYEVTQQQYDAVTAWATEKKCPVIGPDTLALPATGLSWFETQVFTAQLSEWARSEASEVMPSTDGKIGFFRLPSEAEWEFAARGGVMPSDQAAFNARRFEMKGELEDYAWFAGITSSRGEIQPVGVLAPNPLGLFDIYGNAEEMVDELFSLNRGGRRHGQYGGFIARGGSFKNKPNEIGSATRNEYSFYDATDAGVLRSDKIGFRVVLSNFILSSDRVLFDVVDAWERELDPADTNDPRGLLTRMIDEETVVSKRSELAAIQSALVSSLRKAQEATDLALRRAIFSGAALLRSMNNLRPRRNALAQGVRDKNSEVKRAVADIKKLTESSGSEAAIAVHRDTMYWAKRTLQSDRARLARYERDLEVDATNYAATVNALYESSTTKTLRAEADKLIVEMRQSNQLEMIEPINQFIGLVEQYRKNPSMTRKELLAYKK